VSFRRASALGIPVTKGIETGFEKRMGERIRVQQIDTYSLDYYDPNAGILVTGYHGDGTRTRESFIRNQALFAEARVNIAVYCAGLRIIGRTFFPESDAVVS
jgi:hypothetical protein